MTERPQPVNHERLAVRPEHLAKHGMSSWVVNIDVAIPEIAYQQITCLRAKRRWRNRQAPRRIQVAIRSDAFDKSTIEIECIDETLSWALDVVIGHIVALRIGDIELIVEILDIEWRISRGEGIRGSCLNEPVRFGAPESPL